jgi:catechol 2,3-dioxygenase-like lactoylglutathione lyase family enzyme
MRRIVEIALFTDEPDKVIVFYEQLLAALPVQRWEGGASFDLGGLTLLIHEREASDPHGPANRDHVAIGVEDVDGAAGHLREQGFDIDGPRNYYWGRSAYLHDPDGRMLELHQPE